MIDCPGNSRCRQKPVKWGMKLWSICDDQTGYWLGFNVYTGKSDDAVQNPDLDEANEFHNVRPLGCGPVEYSIVYFNFCLFLQC